MLRSDEMSTGVPIRVLHVIPSVAPSTGGPAAALGRFIAAAEPFGVSSNVLTTDASGEERPEWCAKVRVQSAHALRHMPMNVALGFLPFLAREVRDFDCVHLHGNWQFHSLATAAACRVAGRPMVIRTCGGLSAMDWARAGKRIYLRLIEGRVFDQAQLIHYTTQQERLESERMIGARPCRVIPTPVSHQRVDRAEARERLRIPESALLVLFVGRLDPIKRCDVLVRALVSARPEATLALVGPDWGARKELEDLARSLGVASRVLFVGPQRRIELQRWHAAADVFAMASAHENFGLAAAEACAAGLPCVLPAELPIAGDLGEACLAVEMIIGTRLEASCQTFFHHKPCSPAISP